MNENSKTRKSNIELLRIISIILIVLSHVLSKGIPIDIEQAGNSFENIMLVFFKYCGQIGNTLFIIISSYFLVGRNKKLNIRKIIEIIINTSIISLIFLIVFKINGIDIDRIKFLNYLLPTIYNLNYWFIGCYIIFYLIHPLLNIIINQISQKSLRNYNIAFFVMYCVFNIIFVEPQFYYTDLIGFICIYFFVAYMKLYKQDFFKSFSNNFVLLVISIVCVIYLIIISEYIGISNEYYNYKILYFCKIYNPFVIGVALALFNIFYNHVKINDSKIINYLASLSLVVYAITDNYILREEVRGKFFIQNWNKGIFNLVGFEFMRLTICGFILAIIYNLTIQRIVKLIINNLFVQEKVNDKKE